MKKILLADDHVIIREGLKIMLQRTIPHTVVEEAINGDSAFEKLKKNVYDLIILDVNMPNTDCFGLVSNIMAIRPDAKILMFSMNAEEMYAKKYLQLGAKGYVCKDADEDEIVKAVMNVLDNKRYISPALGQVLANEAFGNKSANPFNDLSHRELELVMHLVKGESASEISKILILHPSTIGTYKARIFEKLDCSNIVDLNTMAKMYNIIPQ